MAFSRSIIALSLGETPIENLFIQDYLPYATADQVRVFLAGLMYAHAGRDVSCAAFAHEMGLSVAYLRRIYDYWQGTGLVELVDNPEQPNEFTITYHSARALVYSVGAAQPRTAREADRDAALARLVVSLKGSAVNSREYAYLQEFVATAENGYAIAEQILTLYYVDRARKSFLELERILSDIKRLEITTVADALLHAHRLLDKKEVYKRIKLLFSDKGTTTAAEQSTIDQWFDEFGYTEEQILRLVADFSTRTLNPNIAFLHTLIKEHHQAQTQPRAAFRSEVKGLLTGGSQRVNRGESAIIDSWLDELGLSEDQIRSAIQSFAPERQSPSIDYIDKRLRGLSMQAASGAGSGADASGSADTSPTAAKPKRRKSIKQIDSFSDDELEQRLLSKNKNKL